MKKFVGFVLVLALCAAGYWGVTKYGKNSAVPTPTPEPTVTPTAAPTIATRHDVADATVTVAPFPRAEKTPEDWHEVTFLYAKDGDTIVVRKDGAEVTVRLIGVDTPESVAWDDYLDATGKQNTPEGKEASAAVKALLKEGMSLWLEYDVSPTDKYGRELAYVRLPGGQMLQDWLLERGYARTATVQPNVKYADHFAEVQAAAAAAKKGFWGGFFEEE